MKVENFCPREMRDKRLAFAGQSVSLGINKGTGDSLADLYRLSRRL